MAKRGWVIAIDGPAGSGKSTVGRALAERLGVGFLQTGAMYRAVALEALRRGADLDDGLRLGHIARDVEIDVGDTVHIGAEDVTSALRSPEVESVVSKVAAHPEVRSEMVRRQVDWVVEHGGGVVEGRDIGSVVLPSADLKVFLEAGDDVRVRRRARDMELAGIAGDPSSLAERDRIDSSRSTAPLRVAEGAVVVDASEMRVSDVVDELLLLLEDPQGGSIRGGQGPLSTEQEHLSRQAEASARVSRVEH